MRLTRPLRSSLALAAATVLGTGALALLGLSPAHAEAHHDATVIDGLEQERLPAGVAARG